jgi:hypothetical protein
MTHAEPSPEPTVKALHALSPRDHKPAILTVRELAQRWSIKAPITPAQGLQRPAEGIPLRSAEFRQEGCSPQSIKLHTPIVKTYLERSPTPTSLDIQQWLADRIQRVSAACHHGAEDF